MISRPQKTVLELFREGTLIDRALRQGVRQAIKRHKQLGNSIVVWRDGRTVEIPADEIRVDDADDDSGS